MICISIFCIIRAPGALVLIYFSFLLGAAKRDRGVVMKFMIIVSRAKSIGL